MPEEKKPIGRASDDPKDPYNFKCRNNPPEISVLDDAHEGARVSSKPVDKSPRRYSF